MIDARVLSDRYRHWHLTVEGQTATLLWDVDEKGGLSPDYDLKLNSYDLAVDFELADAVQRLRFEHPEVSVVVIRSANPKVFSAGANIRMLGSASHTHKVAFCKFTNETRLAMEDASRHSGQKYIAALTGPAAGGGYELALATDWILLVDDGNSAVSLPEVPLLGVLPGTGGLVRLVDKRGVRRDHADVFTTLEEGIRGKRAREWRLVDEIAPPSKYEDRLRARVAVLAGPADRPEQGIRLTPLERRVDVDQVSYRTVSATLDTEGRACTIMITPPIEEAPDTPEELVAIGDAYWPLALARELDDLVLHLRHNHPEISTLVFRSAGCLAKSIAHDDFLTTHQNHWLAREIRLYWSRLLKRIELTSRSVITLVEPGSVFGGFLLELVLLADRSFMLDGTFDGGNEVAQVSLCASNFEAYAGLNGMSRVASRFFDDPDRIPLMTGLCRQWLTADEAEQHRLVTFTPDDIDWEDEVRLAIDERASFSSDALTGMEATLRCPGQETMESRIFGRLSAWQNWIFQRPNAVGESGAITLYGTGKRVTFDKERV